GLTFADAPTHLTTTALSATSVDLSWDAMQGATGYNVKVEIDGGGMTVLATNTANAFYHYTNATPGSSNVFHVYAVNASGTSPAADSNAILTVPAAQTDFAATSVSATEVDLSWTDVHGATSYTIERKVGSGSYVTLTSPALSGAAHSYQDT